MTLPAADPWNSYCSTLQPFLERPNDEVRPTPGKFLWTEDGETTKAANALLSEVETAHPEFFRRHPYSWLHSSNMFGGGADVASLELQIYALKLLAMIHDLPVWTDTPSLDPVRLDAILVVVPRSPDSRIRIEPLPGRARVIIIPAGHMALAERIARAWRLFSAADPSLRAGATRLIKFEIAEQRRLVGGYTPRPADVSGQLGHAGLEQDVAAGVFAEEDFVLADTITMGALFHELVHALYDEEATLFSSDHETIAHDASADRIALSLAPMMTPVISSRYNGLTFGPTLAGPYAVLTFQVAMLIRVAAAGDQSATHSLRFRIAEAFSRLDEWVETVRKWDGLEGAPKNHVQELTHIMSVGKDLARSVATAALP